MCTGSPMTPVEHARTSAVSTPSAAAAADDHDAGIGVTALAGRGVRLAALTITARPWPAAMRRAAQVDGGGRDAVRREQAGDGRARIADEQARGRGGPTA